MRKLTSAKIFFCLAVMLFVAKPFLGFSMVSLLHPPVVETIFVKAFTKRKLEHNEDSKFDMGAIQKKLAEPLTVQLLLFSFLLSIIFPVALASGINISNRFLNDIQLSLVPDGRTYLLNGKLII